MKDSTSVFLGTYMPGKSLLHQLDPRTKWVVTLLLAIDLYKAHTFVLLLPVATWVFLSLLISQIRIRSAWHGLRPVMPLLLLMAIIHILFDQGQVVVQAGPLQITKEGLYTAGFTTLQFVLLFLAAALLSWTTVPLELARGLEQMFSPLKRVGIPVHAFAMAIVLAYRFFPILMGEWEKINRAQAARGADYQHGSLPHRLYHVSTLVIPMLIHTFERAEELSIAMDARGYRGDVGRTHYYQLAFRPIDLCILVMIGLITLLMWWLALS